MIGRMLSLLKRYVIDVVGVAFVDPTEGSSYAPQLRVIDVEDGNPDGTFGVRNTANTDWDYLSAREFDGIDPLNRVKFGFGLGGAPGYAAYCQMASDGEFYWGSSDADAFSVADLRARRPSASVLLVDDASGGAAEVRAAKLGLAAGVFFTSYAGSPENNVAANKGAICSDTTNAKLYFKTTNTVSTGWVEMARV